MHAERSRINSEDFDVFHLNRYPQFCAYFTLCLYWDVTSHFKYCVLTL